MSPILDRTGGKVVAQRRGVDARLTITTLPCTLLHLFSSLKIENTGILHVSHLPSRPSLIVDFVPFCFVHTATRATGSKGPYQAGHRAAQYAIHRSSILAQSCVAEHGHGSWVAFTFSQTGQECLNLTLAAPQSVDKKV